MGLRGSTGAAALGVIARSPVVAGASAKAFCTFGSPPLARVLEGSGETHRGIHRHCARAALSNDTLSPLPPGAL